MGKGGNSPALCGSITRETKRSPGEIRFYTTKLSLSTNSSFPSARPKPALNTQTFRYLTEVVFGS